MHVYTHNTPRLFTVGRSCFGDGRCEQLSAPRGMGQGVRQQREVPGRDETETGRGVARQGVAGALPPERVSCSWERLSRGVLW